MAVDRRSFLAAFAAAVSAQLGLPQDASAQLAAAEQQAAAAQADPQPSPAPATTADQAELDRRFAAQLSGCLFAGSYSVTKGNEEKAAVMEKYAIAKVVKVKDDAWLFTAKWQIGKNEFPIVIPLQVKWAGSTPVITLDELTIPGLGTFSSRVLIHEDWYAGTWKHGKVGGHLWGRIERPEEPQKGD